MMPVSDSHGTAKPPVSTPAVLWDVVARHLEEATRAVEQFEAALDRPQYSLRSLHRGPEERLLAHLDGLAAAGKPAVERVLFPALEASPPPSAAMAEAIVLALLMQRQRDAVWAALGSPQSEVVSGAVRAVTLKADAAFDTQILEELYLNDPRVSRAVLLEIAAARRLQPPTLLPFLDSSDPAEAASALRATMGPSGAIYRKTITSHLEDAHPWIRTAALLAGLQVGSGQAWSLCRKLGLDRTAPHPMAMTLMAGLGGSAEHRELEKLLELDSHRPHVVRALGYAGQIESIDVLLSLVDGDGGRVSRLAAEAIATIAGLESDVYAIPAVVRAAPVAVAGPVAPVGPTVVRVAPATLAGYAVAQAPLGALTAPIASSKTMHGLGPVQLAGSCPVAPEPYDLDDELPDGDPDALRSWWQEAKSAFSQGGRYVVGLPRSLPSIVCAMDKLPLRRRHAFGLILSIRTGGRIWIDTRAFASTQRKQRHRAALFLGTVPPSNLAPY